MKLDLDNDNVFELETTVAKARSYFDGVDIEEAFPEFTNVLDNAQGHVSQGDNQEAYLIIKIIK